MQSYLDFHTHILPGVDDGAPDLSVSEQMLDALAKQGVDTVVLTPHFYSDKIPLAVFLERREKAFQQLISRRAGKKPQLVLGAEVFFSDILMNYEDLSALTIGNSNYLLLEMPFQSTFSPYTIDRLYQLSSNANVNFIFAHIDRYPPLMKHPALVQQLRELGWLMQVNLDALQTLKKRRYLMPLLKQGGVLALATDCHNMTTRPPNYTEGIHRVEKKLGNAYIDQMNNIIFDVLQIEKVPAG